MIKQQYIVLIKTLRKAQSLADGVLLGNGGELDSILGSICDDLAEQQSGNARGLSLPVTED